MLGDAIAGTLERMPNIWKAITALIGAVAVGMGIANWALAGGVRTNAAAVRANTERIRENATTIQQMNVNLGAIESQVRLNVCLTLAERTEDDWRTRLDGGAQ